MSITRLHPTADVSEDLKSAAGEPQSLAGRRRTNRNEENRWRCDDQRRGVACLHDYRG